MKSKLLLAGAFLCLVFGFTGCKKEPDALRDSLLGKWRVEKIETTTYTSSGTSETVSVNYGTSDYFEFKDNRDNDFVLGLGTSTTIGTYSSLQTGKFFLDFTTKDLECDVITVDGTRLQFVGTVTGSSPRVTETYYLRR